MALLLEVGLLEMAGHNWTYGAPSLLDEHTAKLCSWCKENDVSEQSLELQLWWRNHKLADERREVQEVAARLVNIKAEHEALSVKLDELQDYILSEAYAELEDYQQKLWTNLEDSMISHCNALEWIISYEESGVKIL
jgi:predicted transcriptional regulator